MIWDLCVYNIKYHAWNMNYFVKSVIGFLIKNQGLKIILGN